jgi:NADPH:quinone reductase-like Zn-dependent oxidoreductase
VLVSTLEPDEKKAAEMGVRTVPRWHAEPKPAELGKVLELIANGEVAVTVAKHFPLAEVRDAQHFAQTEQPRGKVMLDIA